MHIKLSAALHLAQKLRSGINQNDVEQYIVCLFVCLFYFQIKLRIITIHETKKKVCFIDYENY